MKTVLVVLYFLLYVCFMATCFMFAIGPPIPSDKIDEIVNTTIGFSESGSLLEFLSTRSGLYFKCF